MNALDMSAQTLFYIVLALLLFGAVWLISLTKKVSILTMLVNELREQISVRPASQPHAPGAFMPVANKGQFVAAISAALAEHMGADISGLRIRSIKQLSGGSGGGSDRARFIAAVSAAIAEDMGTDAASLRIKSVRRI